MKCLFTILMVLGALVLSWGQTLVRYTFDTVGMAPSPDPIETGVGIFALPFSVSANNLSYVQNGNAAWTAPQARAIGGWNGINANAGKFFSFQMAAVTAEDFSITGISFAARSNINNNNGNQGPTAYSVSVAGVVVHTGVFNYFNGLPKLVDIGPSELAIVPNISNLKGAEIRIIGWQWPFLPTNGNGAFLIDNVIVKGDAFFPITLTSFTARPSGKSVQLDWRTATELNNDYMEVQHSTDGRHYSKIGSVQGAGTTQEEQAYEFRHETPAAGLNYYRLLQVDYDGAYEYHGPVSVRMNGDKGGQLSLFPTVASETVEVQYEGTLSSEAEWQVIDLNGRVWQQQRWEAKSASFSLPVQDLPAGMYLLRLQRGREVETVRFVKQ